MQTQTTQNDQATSQQLFIKMALDAWQTYNKRFDKLVDSLTDEQLAADTAPNRNSGIYLLGHLLAVHDGMLPLLDLGERLYPQLDEVFLSNPDKSGREMPSVSELKVYRSAINDSLNGRMAQLQPADWFTRHSAVSEEAFAKEPHRNKLNIVLNRTNHLSYHLGQLAYLMAKG